nr:ABC transporter permease [Actinomycetota bacterium]
MTTTTAVTPLAQPAAAGHRDPLVQRLRWAASDALTLARRDMMVWLRVPSFIVFTVVQPVMFVLLFRYVFGGAIPVKAHGGYVNYLMPGIIGQSAAFASFSTAI